MTLPATIDWSGPDLDTPAVPVYIEESSRE